MHMAKYIRCVRFLHLCFANTISNRQNKTTGLGDEQAPIRQASLPCYPTATHKLRDVAGRLSLVLGGEESICFLVHSGHDDDILQFAVLPRNLLNFPQLLQHSSVDIGLLDSGLEIKILEWNESLTIGTVRAILRDHAARTGF
jgi:hypothetical protein